jgi:hypothetical protein
MNNLLVGVVDLELKNVLLVVALALRISLQVLLEGAALLTHMELEKLVRGVRLEDEVADGQPG